MPAVISYGVMACGTGTKVAGPLSSSASGYRGLPSVVAAMAVVVCEPSGDGAGVNISGVGRGCVD